MGGDRSKALLALSVIWIAIAAAYMGWGAFENRGLYRWLVELQVAQFGGYYPRWTGILPALLLALPAIGYLRLYSDAQAAAAPQGPAAEAQRGARVAKITATIGVLAGIVGVAAYVLAQSVPDGSEAAVPVAIAELGQGAVPSTKVSVRGTVDDDASGGVSESGGFADESNFYVGCRPESGGGKGDPVRLFIARRVGGSVDAATTQAFMPEQTGYLVENGLPALVLQDLQSRGVAVATPHYVLQPGDRTRRDPYYVAAGLGGAVFVICLLVALIGGLQARARARAVG